MDQIAISSLLEDIKRRNIEVSNAEVSIIYNALWHAHNGMRPLQALKEAIKEYDDIQEDIEINS